MKETETLGPWKVTTNVINDITMYGVYRPLGNPGEPDHSGNREVHGYFDSREEALEIVSILNQDNHQPNNSGEILKHFPVPDELREGTRVAIELISENPYNPRKRFDEEKLAELAESIKEVGIIQPLVVTDSFDGYMLIAGERRLKAAKMAGLTHVPVVYQDFGTREWIPLMLIENLQREDLDPIEEAQAFKTLTQDHGWKQTELAEKLGISQSHIANRIRLLVLPESVQEGISDGRVTATAGKELATYAKVPGVAEVLDEAMSDGDDDGEALIYTAKSSAYDNIKPLHHHAHPDPQFNLKSCERCRERIHLPARWGDDRRLPWCTDTGCWKEKQEAALEEIAEKARQQAIDAGEEVLQLEVLPGGACKRLDMAVFDKAECTQCEHRRQGRYSWMDEGKTEDVCLNPDCFNPRQEEAEKAERQREKEIRDAHEERKESLIAGFYPQALFDTEVERDGSDYQALVYMTAQAIYNPPYSSSMTKAKVEAAVYERYGWEQQEDLSWEEEVKHLVDQLATLTVGELLRLNFFVMLMPVSHDNRVFEAVYGEGDDG